MNHAWLVAILGVGACGGKAAPQEPAPVVEAPRAQRVPIEDDDEPEDGVEFVSARGRMDPAVIEAGIAPHTQALSDCYTTRVGRRRWLGGHVSIHWEIAKTGEVTAVKLAESDLGAWPVEKCLLEAARAASFDKPTGGDADFSLPLDFSAKGRSLTWEEDMAIRAVGGQLAALDACADPSKGPKPRGKAKGKAKKPAAPPPAQPENVTVTLYVGPGGKAQSVGFASPTTVIEDAWADCAEKIALAWRLPDPRGTVAKLAIRYRPQ